MITREDLDNFKNEILVGVQRSINTALLHQKNFSEFKKEFTYFLLGITSFTLPQLVQLRE